MNKTKQYQYFDKIFREAGIEPTIPSSEYISDSTWIVTDLAIGEMAINIVDDKIWIRTESGIKEIVTSSSSVSEDIKYLTGTTYTLPAITETDVLSLKKTNSGSCIISTPSTEKIDGEDTQTITQYECIRLKSDGSNWNII